MLHRAEHCFRARIHWQTAHAAQSSQHALDFGAEHVQLVHFGKDPFELAHLKQVLEVQDDAVVEQVWVER